MSGFKFITGGADPTFMADGVGDAASPYLIKTGSVGIAIAQTPVITAGAYSAKDAVGGLLTFADAARVSGGYAKINTAILADKAFVANVLNLYLFKTTFTSATDNGAFDPADSDLANCVGVISFAAATYYPATDNQIAIVPNVGIQYNCVGTSLYGQLMCTATPTFASTSDLTVILQIEYMN